MSEQYVSPVNLFRITFSSLCTPQNYGQKKQHTMNLPEIQMGQEKLNNLCKLLEFIISFNYNCLL